MILHVLRGYFVYPRNKKGRLYLLRTLTFIDQRDMERAMMDTLIQKKEKLCAILHSFEDLAVAFSGGVDSTFLLHIAHEVLNDRVIAVTAAPAFVPVRELQEARSFCVTRGIRQIVIPAEELNIDSVRHNPPDRCYHCKKEIFGRILAAAAEEGIHMVAEGSNTDDTGDYRPGMKAIRELDVRSPLLEAGLSKADIRTLSRELNLATWNKSSFACLASRFVYGEAITDERLSMVDQAEQLLMDLDFQQFRVRIHGDLARIEVLPEDLPRFAEADTRALIYQKMKDLGFTYVTLDLAGYRTGSMNEVLKMP